MRLINGSKINSGSAPLTTPVRTGEVEVVWVRIKTRDGNTTYLWVVEPTCSATIWAISSYVFPAAVMASVRVDSPGAEKGLKYCRHRVSQQCRCANWFQNKQTSTWWKPAGTMMMSTQGVCTLVSTAVEDGRQVLERFADSLVLFGQRCGGKEMNRQGGHTHCVNGFVFSWQNTPHNEPHIGQTVITDPNEGVACVCSNMSCTYGLCISSSARCPLW